MRRTCIVGAVAVVLAGCSTSIHETATSVPSSAIAATTAGSSLPAHHIGLGRRYDGNKSSAATAARQPDRRRDDDGQRDTIDTDWLVATGRWQPPRRLPQRHGEQRLPRWRRHGHIDVTHETTGAEYGPTAAQTVLCSGPTQTLTLRSKPRVLTSYQPATICSSRSPSGSSRLRPRSAAP